MKGTLKFFKTTRRLIILLLILAFFNKRGFGQGQVVNPTSPWTVPPGVTSVKIEVWGGGGGGGAVQSFLSTNGGGGGGGGAYNVANF